MTRPVNVPVAAVNRDRRRSLAILVLIVIDLYHTSRIYCKVNLLLNAFLSPVLRLPCD